MRTLTSQDLEDILYGTTILGSGGGATFAFGKQMLDFIRKLPARPALADPERDVPDGAMMAIAAGIGSIQSIPKGIQDAVLRAFEGLEALHKAGTGRDFGFVLPGETGPGNVLVPLAIGAQKKLPVVDAAGARRSIPTLSESTWASNGLPIAPIVVCGARQQIRFDAPDAATAEPIMRAIVSGPDFGQGAGIAFWGMDGATMKKAAVGHTISYAHQLGKALRQAGRKGLDPVAVVTDCLKGRVLFRGHITQSSEASSGGFEYGTVTLQDERNQAQLWIYNQNENLIAWNSTRPAPVAMAPDLICYLTAGGQPFTNGDLATVGNKEVVVIGAPSTPELRVPSIVAAFLATYKSLGYGGPYVPIEEL